MSEKRTASEADLAADQDAKKQKVEGKDHSESAPPKKIVRVWTDGCFDMMHYGHANALRQAKTLGDYLIVGVHSDADILKNKGPPVMKEEERYKAVAACKWVDEVVKGAPYVTSLEMLNDYNIDFCVHGDDIVTSADGTDCYDEVKRAGKFKTVPRTKGVSTTDLVGRMLLMTKSHHLQDSKETVESAEVGTVAADAKGSPYTRLSQFIPTTRQIVQFSEGKSPGENDKIVYIDGTFDLFHVGHISVLEKAKQHGDYLIVGVHTDEEVNRVKGENHPIMNLHERVLGVLSCRYVDEVIIGAPYKVDEAFIKMQEINVVVHGRQEAMPCEDGSDPFSVPKDLGIFVEVDSDCEVTTTMIIDRILENRRAFALRNAKKEAKELQQMNQ